MLNPISDDDAAPITFFEDSGTIYKIYNGSQFFRKEKISKKGRVRFTINFVRGKLI